MSEDEAAYKIATNTMVAVASTKPAVASTSRWTGVPQAARWHLALFGFHKLLPQVMDEVCGRRAFAAHDADADAADDDDAVAALLARDVDEARPTCANIEMRMLWAARELASCFVSYICFFHVASLALGVGVFRCVRQQTTLTTTGRCWDAAGRPTCAGRRSPCPSSNAGASSH